MTPALRRQELSTGWTLVCPTASGPESIRGREVPAAVPGCVHTDLLAAGLIEDPFLDDNATLQAWIGKADWTYRSTFDADAVPDGARRDLVFPGLDTVARILVDGVEIGRAANQHRPHRFNVTGALGPGRHELSVEFASPVRHANAQAAALGARPSPYAFPFHGIRKSAASFGWDWGASTATSGISAPALLETYSVARLDEVRVAASPLGEADGRVDVQVRVDRAAEAPELLVRLRVAGAEATGPLPGGVDAASLSLDVASVARWWPVGYGEPALYEARITLEEPDGTVLDATTRRIGFREISWDMTPDEAGTTFLLRVNGTPVFVKGVNWIPDDLFPTRLDPARYRHRLEQARAAHVNLVRVWGGGIYEDDALFDACDELGLLTWQDFAFACAAYADEEPLRGEIAAEARHQIGRLAHHASLALLCGCNENLMGFEEWGWPQLLDGKSWGAYYYHELFPALVAELAPGLTYIPGSPFSPGGHAANDPDHGSMHVWDPWNVTSWSRYRDQRPRFVAEFGYQGPPTWSTMVAAVSDDPLTPESPGMLEHQKASDGNLKLTRGLVPHLRVPDDLDGWHWAMQLNQAHAVRFALDHYRGWWPHTAGAIVWQLNDCWPVTSWSAIDGYGRPKPVYYAMREAFAPRTLAFLDDGATLAIGNDDAQGWAGALRVRRLRFDGTEADVFEDVVDVAPHGTCRIQLPAGLRATEEKAAELLVADLDGVRGFWYFAEPRELALPRPRIALRHAGPGRVEVSAETLVRDLTFLVDKLAPGAQCDQALLTLLPGESVVVGFTGLGQIDLAALAAPSVLKTVHSLVTPG